MKRDGIWVVSTGSYSDYRVRTACPSKKDAERLAQRMRTEGDRWGTDDATVEWLPITAGDAKRLERLTMTTTLWDDGHETDTNIRSFVEWPWDAEQGAWWRWVRAPMHKNGGGRLEVWGTDHERVRKIYGDKRAELLSDEALRRRSGMNGSKR